MSSRTRTPTRMAENGGSGGNPETLSGGFPAIRMRRNRKAALVSAARRREPAVGERSDLADVRRRWRGPAHARRVHAGR